MQKTKELNMKNLHGPYNMGIQSGVLCHFCCAHKTWRSETEKPKQNFD